MASTNILIGDSGRHEIDDDDLRPHHNNNESTAIVNVDNVIKLTESSVKGCANIGYGRYSNILLLAKLLKYLKQVRL